MNLHILKELYILLIVCHLEKIEENITVKLAILLSTLLIILFTYMGFII